MRAVRGKYMDNNNNSNCVMCAVRGGGASNTPTLRVFDPVKVLCIMCLYVCVCLRVHWAGFRPPGGVERTFTSLKHLFRMLTNAESTKVKRVLLKRRLVYTLSQNVDKFLCPPHFPPHTHSTINLLLLRIYRTILIATFATRVRAFFLVWDIHTLARQ